MVSLWLSNEELMHSTDVVVVVVDLALRRIHISGTDIPPMFLGVFLRYSVAEVQRNNT